MRLKAKISHARKSYYTSILKNTSGSQKWKVINSLSQRKMRYNNPDPNTPDRETFLSFFSKIISTDYIEDNYFPKGYNEHSIFLQGTDYNEVLNCLNMLPNKSCQTELDIPLFLWKRIGYIVAEPLTLLANYMLKDAIFPQILKIADVVPIYKKGDGNLPNNYRQVLLLHNLSKVFERIILRRFIPFINKHNLLPD